MWDFVYFMFVYVFLSSKYVSMYLGVYLVFFWCLDVTLSGPFVSSGPFVASFVSVSNFDRVQQWESVVGASVSLVCGEWCSSASTPMARPVVNFF